MRRDALLAAALTAAALTEGAAGGAPAWKLALAAAITGCLVLRRRVWIPVIIQSSGYVILGAAGSEPSSAAEVIAPLITLFTAGERLALRPAIAALVLVMSAAFVEDIATEELDDAVWVALVLLLPPWVIGRAMGDRRRRAAELEALHSALREERARIAAAEADAERVRVAREMHDALSHGLSLIALQAGAGTRLADPAARRDAFRTIRLAAESSLAELDAMLGPSPAAAPELAAIVEGARGAGVQVALSGDAGELPAGVAVALRRIVQEAVTNALKHSGAEQIEVAVRREPDAVQIEVRDDGAGKAVALPGSGRGLAGMRERAAAYGGSVTAGPDGGGFVVVARLPIQEAG